MKNLKSLLATISLPLIAVLLTGCLITGTFITEILFTNIDFVPTENLYREQVDLTEDDTWEEHQDDIKSIDLIGFELWITNSSGSDQTFQGYVNPADEQYYSTAANVQSNATVILDELTLAPGPNYVSYPQSFTYIKNIETLKTLVESGQLNVYGLVSGGSFTLDSLRVIVTFTAGQ